MEHGTKKLCGQLDLGVMYLQRLGIKWNLMPSFLGSDEGREIKSLDDYYRTKYLRLTYQHTLIPINGKDMWEQALGVDVKPPVFPSKKKGNLQFKRRLEPGEISTKQFGKVGKSGVKIHCSHYGGEGHNKQICSQRQPQVEGKFLT